MAKAKPFDAAEYLDSPEMIAAYINEALESEDASAIAVAIGTVARARGMSAVAEKAGLSRENLYRALGGEARPEFGTVIKVLHALGIDLVAQPQGSRRLRRRGEEQNRVQVKRSSRCTRGERFLAFSGVDGKRPSFCVISRDHAPPKPASSVARRNSLPSCYAISSVKSSLYGVMSRQCASRPIRHIAHPPQ